jgi:hypothetical protein
MLRIFSKCRSFSISYKSFLDDSSSEEFVFLDDSLSLSDCSITFAVLINAFFEYIIRVCFVQNIIFDSIMSFAISSCVESSIVIFESRINIIALTLNIHDNFSSKLWCFDIADSDINVWENSKHLISLNILSTTMMSSIQNFKKVFLWSVVRMINSSNSISCNLFCDNSNWARNATKITFISDFWFV